MCISFPLKNLWKKEPFSKYVIDRKELIRKLEVFSRELGIGLTKRFIILLPLET